MCRLHRYSSTLAPSGARRVSHPCIFLLPCSRVSVPQSASTQRTACANPHRKYETIEGRDRRIEQVRLPNGELESSVDRQKDRKTETDTETETPISKPTRAEPERRQDAQIDKQTKSTHERLEGRSVRNGCRCEVLHLCGRARDNSSKRGCAHSSLSAS